MNQTISENQTRLDKLPPFAEQAERALIGCILLQPDLCMAELAEKFGTEEVFYDLRNRTIWTVCLYLLSVNKTIDMVTVRAELQARNQLTQAGDHNYLTGCFDEVTSPANWPAWAELVWEKFVARRHIQQNVEQARTLMEYGGAPSEAWFAQADEDYLKLQRLRDRGETTPKNLCPPADFGDGYYKIWFQEKDDELGYALPFAFPWRIRPNESTLFTGDNGSGKSSMLGQIAINCARQFNPGKKVVVASMEVPPERTLWILARQLLGRGHLERTHENERLVSGALAWLNERMLIYNFLGITDWRELLNTFRYAREHSGGEVFTVDSVMRIGIADDDYAMQGLAAARFAEFAVKHGGHVFLVIHENKSGDRRAKDKVRGSKQWTDSVDNVCSMYRNEKKSIKEAELEEQLRIYPAKKEEIQSQLDDLAKDGDAKFILHKQRYAGSRQNASRWLYFHKGALQFHEHPLDEPIVYAEFDDKSKPRTAVEGVRPGEPGEGASAQAAGQV